MTGDAIELSVIVAAIDGAPLSRTVAALHEQVHGRRVEIVVVVNPGPRGAAADVDPSIRVVVRPQAGLVPHLWGYGMSQARGSILAVTIAGCVPDPGWMDAVLDAYRGDDRLMALGGPILPDRASSVADRALVFTRYGPYLPPVSSSESAEVPGDNGSYRRSAVAADLSSFAADGFWEADVNARLRAAGSVLRMSPAMQMRHLHSFRAAAFFRQRAQHGRIFGAGRARQMSLVSRVVRAIAAPVTIALMTGRAARHAARAGCLASFVPALPLVIVFYGAWVAGEIAGFLTRRP